MISPRANYTIKPFYLDGASGRLFAVSFEPLQKQRGQLLFCPPFAEEMNKSRRMMVLLAQRLCAQGYGVLISDLYGTGDSEGDFADARWDTWISDIERSIRWCSTSSGTNVSLCGIRLGAILALAASERLPALIDKVLLWQPLLLGKTHMTQFLRMKIAAQLTSRGPKTSTSELRAAAENGEMIEVAGYTIHPEMLAAIDAQNMRNYTPPSSVDVSWFEVVAEEGHGFGMASQKLGDDWKEAGVDLQRFAVAGEQFWSSPETTVVPELIQQTANQLATTT